ncbi:MAG: hypothetical protein Q8L14_40190 [Myxococcales bacterium]|nr:hypothetical protein [Myxococcales bacterium]
MSLLALAAVRIRLPAEAQVALAIGGAVIIGLTLLLLFLGRFGKRGAIFLGTIGLAFLALVGWERWQRSKENDRRHARERGEDLEPMFPENARANLAVFRALVADTSPASAPLEKQCAKVFTPDSRFGVIALTSAQPSDSFSVQLRQFDTRSTVIVPAGPLPERISPALDDAVMADVFVVVSNGSARLSSWRSKVSCAGSLKLPPRQLTDDELITLVCQTLQWKC